MSGQVGPPGRQIETYNKHLENYMKTMYGVNKDLIFKLTSMLGQF